MKRIRLSILMITILLLLSGCNRVVAPKDNQPELPSSTPEPVVTLPAQETSKEEEDGEVMEEKPLTVEDYYPLQSNTEYIYEGEGNEYASYRRTIDFIDEDKKRLQTRTDNGGTISVQVLERKDGALSVIYLANESYYRENFLNQTSTEAADILLMEPLSKGTRWTLSDGSTRQITAENVPIITPYGSFDALEVTTEFSDSTTVDYYTAGVGLVKSVFRSEGMEVSSTLSEVKKDTLYQQPITLYYPDADDKIYPVQSELSMGTGVELRLALQEAMRKPIPKETYIPLMSENTTLNDIYLDDKQTVHADFSKEFVTEANLGSGYEMRLLQSVTDTLGKFYGASKVIITLDGKPYESGHVLMKEGEAFDVSTVEE